MSDISTCLPSNRFAALSRIKILKEINSWQTFLRHFSWYKKCFYQTMWSDELNMVSVLKGYLGFTILIK